MNMPHEIFAGQVLAEACGRRESVNDDEAPKAAEVPDLPMFTIDGENGRAISNDAGHVIEALEQRQIGRLQVHIAEVP